MARALARKVLTRIGNALFALSTPIERAAIRCWGLGNRVDPDHIRRERGLMDWKSTPPEDQL